VTGFISLEDEVEFLRAENKRLREALEEIANLWDCSWANEIAQQALAKGG
jgi:hypothetical protein